MRALRFSLLMSTPSFQLRSSSSFSKGWRESESRQGESGNQPVKTWIEQYGLKALAEKWGDEVKDTVRMVHLAAHGIKRRDPLLMPPHPYRDSYVCVDFDNIAVPKDRSPDELLDAMVRMKCIRETRNVRIWACGQQRSFHPHLPFLEQHLDISFVEAGPDKADIAIYRRLSILAASGYLPRTFAIASNDSKFVMAINHLKNRYGYWGGILYRHDRWVEVDHSTTARNRWKKMRICHRKAAWYDELRSLFRELDQEKARGWRR